VDGYRLSTYFYKDKNSVNPKFKMGPLWDFNIALGNANYCNGGSRTGWACDFNGVCPADGWKIPFWWETLFNDKKFKQKIKTRWQALRKNTLKTSQIYAVIDSFSNLLEKPQERNFKKWDILKIWIWPNATVNNVYGNEILYLKDWLNSRLLWMDGEIDAFHLAEHPINITDIEVFPNPSPASTPVRFAYYLNVETEVELQLFNVSGQLLKQQKIKQLRGSNEFVWKENFGTGVFIYRLLRNGEEWKKGKLVKN
jgi:hypothetical protein